MKKQLSYAGFLLPLLLAGGANAQVWSQYVELPNSSAAAPRLATDVFGTWMSIGQSQAGFSYLPFALGYGADGDLEGSVSWVQQGFENTSSGNVIGQAPSISIFNNPYLLEDGMDFVLDVHQAINGSQLTQLDYTLGLCYQTETGCTYDGTSTPAPYDNGANPTVSIDAYATNYNAIPFVEVHQQTEGYSQLYYHVGYFNANYFYGNGELFTWGPAYKVPNAEGTLPSVIVADGEVILVLQGNSGRLWYDVGKISGNTVAWQGSVNYDTGYNPSIALNPTTTEPYFNPSTIVETHQSEAGTASTLTYRVGSWNNQFSPTSISWNGSDISYATGCTPNVALDQYAAAGFLWSTACGNAFPLMWGFAYQY
jgi:hypothetical protein